MGGRAFLAALPIAGLLASVILAFGPVESASAASVFVGSVPEASWDVDGTVYATLQVGNTLYVGGQFNNAVAPNGTLSARKNLAAFAMDTGAPVATFRADAGSTVRALATDGTSLYVGGAFGRLGNVSRSRIGKVDLATGAVDQAFGPVLDDSVRSIQVDGNSLVIGGSFLTVNGTARARLARISASSGALATTFTPAVNNPVYAVKLSPVGRTLYVGGDFTTVGGATRTGVAAVNADTGAVTGPAFASSARPTFVLDTNEDGTRLFGAGGSATNSTAAWNVSTGARQWRVVTDGDNQALDYFGGMVYFGFHDGYQGDHALKLLAADAVTGVVDPSFRPGFDQFWGVWSISASDRGLAVGGDFTTVGGVAASGLARFLATGAPPPPPPTTVTVLGSDSPWRYWDRGTTPAGWNVPGFDDAAWPVGPPRLGYGDTFVTTVIGYGPSASSKYITSYFRAHFTLSALPDAMNLALSVDDGAVVHVNGIEVAREDLPAGAVTGSTLATVNRSGGEETAVQQHSVPVAALRAGDNVVAVEVHQNSGGSSDLGMDLQLDAVTNGRVGQSISGMHSPSQLQQR